MLWFGNFYFRDGNEPSEKAGLHGRGGSLWVDENSRRICPTISRC